MIFSTKNQGNVKISDCDCDYEVWTVLKPPKKIGGFSLSYIDDDGDGNRLALVTGMELQAPYRRQGIGSKILEMILDEGYYPVFRKPDGQKYDDGSHLINDGIGFATAMVDGGTAHWWP
ncbi:MULTISPECIES: GNAT family N-acetyltransferase [Agrobacterium]|uniref:GNAT family N-acetyltransferase n=1 Tax=Agrobacterium tumefaciens TaxID=358 RepID=UPI00157321FF|nr:GNAT family N-acetyltransferase [Agrobacterium tumefaciens]NSZ05616.1 GNAT family N-acetyltransferase [Agrobacterium tumefaciens]